MTSISPSPPPGNAPAHDQLTCGLHEPGPAGWIFYCAACEADHHRDQARHARAAERRAAWLRRRAVDCYWEALSEAEAVTRLTRLDQRTTPVLNYTTDRPHAVQAIVEAAYRGRPRLTPRQLETRRRRRSEALFHRLLARELPTAIQCLRTQEVCNAKN